MSLKDSSVSKEHANYLQLVIKKDLSYYLPMAHSTNQLISIKRWYFTRNRVVDFGRLTSSSC